MRLMALIRNWLFIRKDNCNMDKIGNKYIRRIGNNDSDIICKIQGNREKRSEIQG